MRRIRLSIAVLLLLAGCHLHVGEMHYEAPGMRAPSAPGSPTPPPLSSGVDWWYILSTLVGMGAMQFAAHRATSGKVVKEFKKNGGKT